MSSNTNTELNVSGSQVLEGKLLFYYLLSSSGRSFLRSSGEKKNILFR